MNEKRVGIGRGGAVFQWASLISLLLCWPAWGQEQPEVTTGSAGDSVESLSKGSAVTIERSGIRLTDAIQLLQKQTGNPVTDLREQMGQEVTNPLINLDLKDVVCLEALDRICEKAGLETNFYTGDGSIGLSAGGSGMNAGAAAGAEPGEGDVGGDSRFVVYSGPFRVRLQEIATRRDFQTGRSLANARFEIAWEPKLRPMVLALDAGKAKIEDENGKGVGVAVQEEEMSINLRSDMPIAELNLNIDAPERGAESLGLLHVETTVTVPAGLRSFRFENLTKPMVVSRGGASVELVSTEVEEHVWKVRVFLEYEGSGPAFESYQQGLFNNRIWLQRQDGSRFEHNGGYSTLGSGDGKIGFEYLFVDAPGKPSDYALVYEAPSEVITLPLTFEFREVPLP